MITKITINSFNNNFKIKNKYKVKKIMKINNQFIINLKA